MAKQRTSAHLSSGELVGGTIFFVIYLLVLPFATGPLFRLISVLLDVNISSGLQNTIYYYVIFAVTVIIFHGLLARTSKNLAEVKRAAGPHTSRGAQKLVKLPLKSYRVSVLRSYSGPRLAGRQRRDRKKYLNSAASAQYFVQRLCLAQGRPWGRRSGGGAMRREVYLPLAGRLIPRRPPLQWARPGRRYRGRSPERSLSVAG